MTWSYQVVDRCTGPTVIAPGGTVTVPPQADRAAAVGVVAAPAPGRRGGGRRHRRPGGRGLRAGASSAPARPPDRAADTAGGGGHADRRTDEGTDADAGAGRRRTREQRRNRRSAAFDLLAVLAAVALVGLGMANLYLIGAADLAARQGLIAAGGVLALAVFWRVRVRFLGVLAWAAYGAAVVLLVGVLAVGLSANGATRWIAIGSLTFQPSELAKLGLLLVLAAVLGSSRPPWQRFVIALLLAVVPIGLTLLQPDLSTAMLLTVLTAAMLVIGRVPARFLLPLAAAAAISAPLLISLLRPYQLARLGSFLVGAHESPTGSGWAVRQAHIAVGSGGLFGRTDDPLRLLRAQYLPERETDLALASLVGQWGLVAGRRGGAGRDRRSCGGSRWPAGRPARRTARSSRGGLAMLWEWRPSSRWGPTSGCCPWPASRSRSSATAARRWSCTSPRIGVVLAVRRDGARRRLWALPGRRNPRPRLVRLAAVGLSVLLVSFGLYGWRLQVTQGEALQVVGDEQMTRCFRLPAPRGSITDRHDVPLAMNAADAGTGVDRVLVVPALLRTRPADVDRLAGLTGRPARGPRRPDRRGGGHHAVAAGGRGAPRHRRRGDRGRDRRRVRRPRAAPRLPAGRAARTGARLRGGGHARGRGALAGPAVGRDRRPRRARAAVRRGAARDQRAAVRLRRPARHAGRARRAAGPRCPAPTCGSRSTWACSAGSTPAWPRPCARNPGRRARSAPPSRWTRYRGRSSPSRAPRRSTTTSTDRRSTAGRCRPWPTRRGPRCWST